MLLLKHSMKNVARAVMHNIARPARSERERRRRSAKKAPLVRNVLSSAMKNSARTFGLILSISLLEKPMRG